MIVVSPPPPPGFVEAMTVAGLLLRIVGRGWGWVCFRRLRRRVGETLQSRHRHWISGALVAVVLILSMTLWRFVVFGGLLAPLWATGEESARTSPL